MGSAKGEAFSVKVVLASRPKGVAFVGVSVFWARRVAKGVALVGRSRFAGSVVGLAAAAGVSFLYRFWSMDMAFSLRLSFFTFMVVAVVIGELGVGTDTGSCRYLSFDVSSVRSILRLGSSSAAFGAVSALEVLAALLGAVDMIRFRFWIISLAFSLRDCSLLLILSEEDRCTTAGLFVVVAAGNSFRRCAMERLLGEDWDLLTGDEDVLDDAIDFVGDGVAVFAAHCFVLRCTVPALTFVGDTEVLFFVRDADESFLLGDFDLRLDAIALSRKLFPLGDTSDRGVVVVDVVSRLLLASISFLRFNKSVFFASGDGSRRGVVVLSARG